MKGMIKAALCGGAFLSIAGVLLSGAGWIGGADRHALDERMGWVIGDVERHMAQVDMWVDCDPSGGTKKSGIDETLEKFHTLDIEAGLGDVRVYTGEEYGLELVTKGEGYQFHYENKDGTLRIWSTSDHDDLDGYTADIDVWLPEGASLEEVTLDLGMGDVDWRDVPVTKSVNWDLNMGDASLRAPVDGKIKLSNGMGDMTLSGTFTGEAEVSTGMGDIDMDVEGEKSQYRYDISAGMGDLSVDGERQRNNGMTGGGGKNEITLSTGMGDLSLTFDR